MLFFLVFFFFQAEDGIRDVAVTGVQTCALPISYRAMCDLTHLFTVTYIHPYNSSGHSHCSSGPPAGACGSRRPEALFSLASAPPKAFFSSYSAPRPFRATHGTCALTVAPTSRARILRGSAGST